MKKHAYSLAIISLIVEILLLVFAIVCLILDTGSRVEWIIIILMDLMGFPGSITFLQKAEQTEKEEKEREGKQTQ